MTRIELTDGASRAAVDPIDGGRLVSLDLGDGELLVQEPGRATMWWGAFPMAPWVSRLDPDELDDGAPLLDPIKEGGDALWHGVARGQRFRVGERSSSVLSLECPLLSPWRGGGSLALRFELRASSLLVELVFTADRPTSLATLGWHPWFVRTFAGATAELALPDSIRVPELDDSGAATGRWVACATEGRAWNEEVRTEWPIAVRYPGVGTLEVSGNERFAILFGTDRTGLCVEPTTGGAGRPTARLRSGEKRRLGIRLDWRSERRWPAASSVHAGATKGLGS